MLLKKMMFKDIADDNGFTDDSYLIVDIPSLREKMELRKKFEASPDNEQTNLDAVISFVREINCKPIDSDVTINDWDTLTCFSFATALITWLGQVMANGYVPKKS